MPVVANVNLLAGTNSSSTGTTDAADSFCLCRNEAQRLFFLEGGGKCDMFEIPSKLLSTRMSATDWKSDGGERGKWDRLAEGGPLPAFSTYVCWPLSDRQDFWLQPWVAAVRNCVWQMTQHLKTQSSDSLRTATNHVRYSFCQPQPRQSFTNGLKWLFESFSVTPRHTIAELRDAITWQVRGKHDSKKNIPATSFFFFFFFRVRQDSAVVAVSFFIHWINHRSAQEGRWQERGDKHLVGNQQPPSEQGRQAGSTSMELLKSGGENATAGLNSQIKGSSAPFSFCFDRKIADYSQFICLCPRLIPGAVKLWLKSSWWWDRITPGRVCMELAARKCRSHCTIPSPSFTAFVPKISAILSSHEKPLSEAQFLQTHLLRRRSEYKYLHVQ